MIRLFLSVDMVGSTEFKARFAAQGNQGWLEIFRAFFSNFPLMLAGQVGFEFIDDECTPSIDVWKAMGDEIIFAAEPQSPDEAVSILRALLRAMALYEAKYFDRLPLRLKGTAWIAAFGEQNIELDIAELAAGDGASHIDFIGPDVDLGFRLSKFSRPSSLVVSLDLLEQLLDAGNVGTLAFHLVGREELKGVMFGRPYPVIWASDADCGFDFLPWEVEACPLMAAAMASGPTDSQRLRDTIDDMRHYLRKMHGVDRAPLGFGSPDARDPR
ncbi:MAG: hypothetical protein U0S50_12940 [Sphingopyxis sp.]|uniref:hypothetical protein n=1 Tax=Sphingopyxis sp. TaxID=1908224 RepID=UPI002AB81D7D|nr:hypothetical protein [Sphingopyxis sp.]MDZ3832701.1 hypothetical protein [Sphingopyxis sp.]